MIRLLSLILFALVIQNADAQRVIRRNSRHFIKQRALPEKVVPLLKDVWDQYAPNNALCPIDSTGERCVVGCVATAMSEVMYYWQWPIQGRGEYTYTDEKGCKQTLTANFSEHKYDWANMMDRYEEGKYTQAQADAVALLSLDCGISVDMRYGKESSGANSVMQPIALTNYFGYDRGVQYLFRDFYSLDEITYILKKELAEGRPVLISGYNKNGGHAFVVDGYDENDWFHTCWGNPGGEDNCYTYLPNLVPNQPEWYDKNSPENGLNLLQMFTIGIMPENHPNATGIERHNFAFQYIKAVKESETDKAIYPRNAVKLTTHDLCNIGWNILEDSVSLMLRKGEDVVCALHTYTHEFGLEELDDTTYNDTLTITIPEGIENGTYTISPMFRDNALSNGNQSVELSAEKPLKEWRAAQTCAGTPNYLIATVKDDEVTLLSDTASTSYLTLEDIDIPDMMINATAPDYTFTFKNHGPEMAGRVYFLLENVEDNTAFYLQEQGITIGANEEYTLHHNIGKLYTPKYGTYRLHIMYEANLFADDLIELELPQEVLITIIPRSSIDIAQR